MPAPQPRMHGSTHVHGGPDPILIAWESTGDSGPLDSFDRADESPINTEWETRSSSPFQIVGGQAVPAGVGNAMGVHVGEAAFADGWASVEVGNDPNYTNRDVGALMRTQPAAETAAASGYFAFFDYNGSTHQILLRKITAGTEANLVAPAPWTPVIGDRVACRCVGTTIEAWAWHAGTWTLLLTATDATYTSGYPGMVSMTSGAVEEFTAVQTTGAPT